MTSRITKPALTAAVALLLAGCAPSVRTGTIAVVGTTNTAIAQGQSPENATAARRDDPIAQITSEKVITERSTISTGSNHAKTVEYIWTGGASVYGASLYPSGENMLLRGRVRASSPSGVAPSKIVRVEAVSSSNEIVWSGMAKVQREQNVHRSGHYPLVGRLTKTGTFEITVPHLSEFDHFHIGVITETSADADLPGTCLHPSQS